MKNRILTSFLAPVLLVVLSSAQVLAAEVETVTDASVNKPITLQESTGFISAKWPEFVDGSVTYAADGIKSTLQDTMNRAQFNQCDAVIDRSLTSTYNGRNTGSLEQKYTFNLKQIDTVTAGFYYDAKEGYTRDGVALFAVILESKTGISKQISDKSIKYSHNSTEKRVEFATRTQENAVSLATAFERAVQLCREEGLSGKK